MKTLLIETLERAKIEYDAKITCTKFGIRRLHDIECWEREIQNINTLLAELTKEPTLEEKQKLFEYEYMTNTSYIFADWDKKNIITNDYKSDEINSMFIGYCIGKGWKV